MANHSLPYRFKASLAFKHRSSDLSDLSKQLGLKPFRQWRIGEPRTTPRGQPLDGYWQDSYWVAELPVPEGTDLESSLSQTAEWLEPQRDLLRQHMATGGTAYLSIGFFISGFNAGILLDPSLLAKYASLGLSLDFDLYSGDESSGAA